jgi:hypothetical protein
MEEGRSGVKRQRSVDNGPNSRGDVEKMFERLGIAAELAPKIILAPGSGPATESVAAGKAAPVVTLFSEIVPVPGVAIWVRCRASFTRLSDSARLSAAPLKVWKRVKL